MHSIHFILHASLGHIAYKSQYKTDRDTAYRDHNTGPEIRAEKGCILMIIGFIYIIIRFKGPVYPIGKSKRAYQPKTYSYDKQYPYLLFKSLYFIFFHRENPLSVNTNTKIDYKPNKSFFQVVFRHKKMEPCSDSIDFLN